jgi:hypothetical protein
MYVSSVEAKFSVGCTKGRRGPIAVGAMYMNPTGGGSGRGQNLLFAAHRLIVTTQYNDRSFTTPLITMDTFIVSD